jgi:hypothetical protein
MKARLVAALTLFLFAAATASAGEIYGKVVKGGAPVGEGAAEIAVKCGDAAYGPTKTDKAGSFRIVAERTGKCALTVTNEGQAASLDIASYDEPVQIDLVLEVKDGKLSARRK